MSDLKSDQSDRAEAIASAWYQVLADNGDIPKPSEVVQLKLLELTRQVIPLLPGDPFQTETAQAIGERLARLGYQRLDASENAPALLSQQLIQGIGSYRNNTLHTRLGNALTQVYTDFSEHPEQAPLVDKESLLQTLEAGRKHFTVDNQEIDQKSDVTKQKQIEEDLRASEARYRSLVETQNEIIGRFTADGTITFVNEAINRLVGVPASDIIGHNILEFVSGVEWQAAQEALIFASQRIPGDSTRTRELKITTPAGNKFHIEAITQAIFNDQEEIIEFQATVRDITALKQAQETLERQNELLRQLSDQLINIQENERQRIARELHDSVLNELGVMMITPAERLTPQAVRDNYEQLIEQLRQTINGLRSPMLNYGLYAALDDLLDSMMDISKAESVCSMEIPASLARFDLNVELHLFRIIQQACDNALQHARAPHIRIYGNIDDCCVNLNVEDDGIGFQLGTETDLAHVLAQKHFGLVSMLERGKLIGANVQITSHPGAGTQVHVLWEPKINPGEIL